MLQSSARPWRRRKNAVFPPQKGAQRKNAENCTRSSPLCSAYGKKTPAFRNTAFPHEKEEKSGGNTFPSVREGFSQRPASAQKIPCGTPLKNISPVPQDVFLPEAYVIACNINKLPCICVFFFLRKKELLAKVPAFQEKPLALIVVLPLFYYRKNCMHFPDFYNPSGRGCHDQS